MSLSRALLAALVLLPLAARASDQDDFTIDNACYTDDGAAIEADGFASRGLIRAHDAGVQVAVEYDLQQTCGLVPAPPFRKVIRIVRHISRDELADVAVADRLNPAGHNNGYLWSATDLLDVGRICLPGQVVLSDLTVLGVNLEVTVEDPDGNPVTVDDAPDGEVIGASLTLGACEE